MSQSDEEVHGSYWDGDNRVTGSIPIPSYDIQSEEMMIERKRCIDIIQMARNGEIDTDFRSIIHMIKSGLSVEQIKNWSVFMINLAYSLQVLSPLYGSVEDWVKVSSAEQAGSRSGNWSASVMNLKYVVR